MQPAKEMQIEKYKSQFGSTWRSKQIQEHILWTDRKNFQEREQEIYNYKYTDIEEFLCEKSKIHTTRTEHSIKIHTLFTKHQSQKVYAFQELKHRNIYIYKYISFYIYIYACNLYISYDSCENNPRTHTFQKHHVFKIAYCCGNFPFT